jgi:hypothetical protein
MVTVGGALLLVAGVSDPWHVRSVLIGLTAALTVGSGVQYLLLAPRFVDWGPR